MKTYNTFTEEQFNETVKNCAGVEFYSFDKFAPNTNEIFGEYIHGLEDDLDLYLDSNGEITCDITIMDEDDYNRHILNACPLEFKDCYNEGDKVAVVLVSPERFTVQLRIGDDDGNNVLGWSSSESTARMIFNEQTLKLQEYVDDNKKDCEITLYEGDIDDPYRYDIESESKQFVGQSLEGKIIVTWSWQTYVGYARKFLSAEIGTADQYECDLIPYQDKVFATQQSFCEDEEDFWRQDWRWTNPNFAEEYINNILGND